MHCGYFDTTRKGNHSSFLTPTVVGGQRPFRLKFALKALFVNLCPLYVTDMRYFEPEVNVSFDLQFSGKYVII